MTKYSRRSVAEGSLVLAAAALLTGGMTTEAAAAQPHMEDALRALRAAMRSLERASRNKGGHRSRAIVLIREAIEEVQAGIDYAD